VNNPGKLCEAHFYIGERNIINNEAKEAAAALKIAAQSCTRSAIEFPSGIAELKRFEQ
jgi:lipoprotein NlpI